MQLSWKNLFAEIETFKTVNFPRCLQPKDAFGSTELHVFADASASVYGAKAYLVWPSPHGKEVRLVSAPRLFTKNSKSSRERSRCGQIQ